MATDEDLLALRDRCTRFLLGHGPVNVAQTLAAIPDDTKVDRYGEGGVVGDLEQEVAALLGKPAAVFLPSGTMAQQLVLRIHAEHRQRPVVLFHPMCHLRQHEGGALERLQQLVGRPVGHPDRLLSLADLEAVAEPVGALLLELPQRDLGGQQPAWADLEAQVAWARECGAAAHLDGARLWESAAGYGRPPADVAALFDTVYVSFYKGVGALPGCCVAGPTDVVAEVREWRARMGGTLFGMWPNAASALSCLRRRLPLMTDYLRHALAVSEALAGVDGVAVVPDPPQTPMFHVLLRTSQKSFTEAVCQLALERGVWTWQRATVTGDPAIQRVELSVGDATCSWQPAEVAEVLSALVSGP